MNNNIQKLLKYPQIIRFLLDHQNDSYTPQELSRQTKISYATVWRYLRELHSLGIVNLTKVGRYNLYRFNEHSPLKKKLGALVDVDSLLKVNVLSKKND